MRILVTGGKGDLGPRVVDRLRTGGHTVLVGTRTPRHHDEVRFDLGSDVGRESLSGVEVVVHLATDPRHTRAEKEGSARLWAAAQEVGVGHVVYVSIVGIDHHPFPYYQTKLAVEQQLESSGLPYTILRATQFHGLIPRFVEEAIRRVGFVPIPGGVPLQPVDADVVAQRVVELVEAGPSGRVPDLGGPEVLDVADMARAYLETTGRRVIRFRAPFWGRAVAAFRRGDQLAPDSKEGGRTYGEYLEELPPRPPDPVGVWLQVVGGALLATTLWMLVSPFGFFSNAAGFGEFNSHFIRDTATFVLPLAVALWLAAGRPSWRVPVLILALLQNGFHVANHVVDVGNTDPAWQGPVNLAALAGMEVVLWLLYRMERRRPSTRGSGSS